jgi:hypothetical protein
VPITAQHPRRPTPSASVSADNTSVAGWLARQRLLQHARKQGGPATGAAHRKRPRGRQLLAQILAALAALTAGCAQASAASIAYINRADGNVWLASQNGSNQRQVTTGGNWSYPSQANDGTIMAVNATHLFRMNRSGQLLAAPIPTVFTGSPFGVGPTSAEISPDGVNQAYSGDLFDPSEAVTFWGSASTFSQPNQKGGQGDWADPGWIDDSHLLLGDTSLGYQVGTYTLGNGDNTAVQWFSDPNVQNLLAPAIDPAGDKLAFIADSGGTLNEVILFQTNGPPPLSTADPANPPTPECDVQTGNFGSTRVSFSPDDQSLTYDAPDGIHLVTLTNWPNCQDATDKLIIPDGASPYYGPTDVGPSAFEVAERTARGGQITLTLSAKTAGTFTAHASAKVGSGRHTSTYGSSSVRFRHKGLVKLTITPSASAARALALAGRMAVSVTVTFTPTGGTLRVKHLSLTVVALRKRAK